ncbi:hypothetical protein CEN46_19860 [Fischerella thermalis CCMEE 5318]|uniref:Uncharacterized protein n=1 Tax=Fischerella thermalis CCMEE 5318 TaxID=2019666 RepID=A0A2N6L9C9_9CYAN|nr:hypothetical protein CEN46_19860 [Fischerella thermalis CCMEE 5318]
MKPKPNDLPKASTYLTNEPYSQTTYLDSNIQPLPHNQFTEIPTNTQSFFGLLLVCLVFILVCSALLQNLRSTSSSTSWTIRFGNLFLVSFRNESSKPEKLTK